MTGTPLAKLYDQLTVPERYPLIIAAMNRNDEVEVRRLLDTAPLLTVPMRDFQPFARAWFTMAALQHIEQLRLAGWLFRFWLIAQEAEALGTRDDAELGTETAWIIAWQFRQSRTAWQLFCQELGFNDRDPLPGMPNDLLAADTFLEMVDSRVASMAFDQEAIVSLLKRKLGEQAPKAVELRTVETRLQGLRDEWAIWQGKRPRR